MRMAIVAALVFMGFQAPAEAQYFSTGTWVCEGILTMQNDEHRYYESQHVRLGPFDTKERANAAVRMFAKSDEFIGEGGTNGHVDRVDWNYDATCIQLN